MSRGKWLLPIAAVCLALVVLGINLAAGGTEYRADEPADPCAGRTTAPIAPKIDDVSQQVVLTGLDEAACKLGVTRERLLLALVSPAEQDALVEDIGVTRPELSAALEDGIKSGIARLERERALPKVSAMLPEIVDQLDLGALGSLAGQIPDSVVDGLLPTAAVLTRAADKIDYEALLTDLQDPDRLESQLRDAIEQGAIDEARARITEQLSSLRDFF